MPMAIDSDKTLSQECSHSDEFRPDRVKTDSSIVMCARMIILPLPTRESSMVMSHV